MWVGCEDPECHASLFDFGLCADSVTSRGSVAERVLEYPFDH